MKGFLNFCQAGNVFKGDMSEPDRRDESPQREEAGGETDTDDAESAQPTA